MRTSPTDPLADIPISARLAALPKADLHVYQEWFVRLDRVLARREGRSPYDWCGWARRVLMVGSVSGKHRNHLRRAGVCGRQQGGGAQVLPRYAGSREFSGETFEDGRYPDHYDPFAVPRPLTADKTEELAALLRRHAV